MTKTIQFCGNGDFAEAFKYKNVLLNMIKISIFWLIGAKKIGSECVWHSSCINTGEKTGSNCVIKEECGGGKSTDQRNRKLINKGETK